MGRTYVEPKHRASRDCNPDKLGEFRGGYNGWGKVVGPTYHSVVHFEKPVSERKPYLYHYVFCPHHELYIRPCRRCGRTREAAAVHERLMRQNCACVRTPGQS